MNPKKAPILTTFMVLFASICAWSQLYTKVNTAQFDPKKLGSVATGDLNNDGYLDIVTSGINEADEMSTSVYINLANGSFEKLPIEFAQVYNSTIVLGDYTNDGYLDILINGEGGNQQWSKLWKNNGDLTFTEMNIGLEQLGGQNCEFRDFNNDGWLDIVLAGDIRLEEGSYLPNTRVYKNIEGNSFERVNQEFGSYARFGTFGDYDNDGDLDLAVGFAVSTFRIYPNLGNGTFGDPIIPKVLHQIGDDYHLEIWHVSGQIKWFDYNNDGRLDILLWGQRFPVVNDYYLTPFSILLENTGEPDEPFRMVETNFANTHRERIDIRDYNADGKSDIVVTGITDFFNYQAITKVYDNTENGFVENSNVSLPQYWGGDVLWLDQDNDGDLDVLITGQEPHEEIIGDGLINRTDLLRNNSGSNTFSKNTIPLAPAKIEWQWQSSSIVSFRWNNGSDEETPQSGLTYNIAIGTTPDDMNVINPESDVKTGKRKIVYPGNAENNLTKTIVGLDSSKVYYFRIQTIDGASAGSKFSEAKLISGTIDTVQTEAIQIYPNPSVGFVTVNLSGVNEESRLKLYAYTGHHINVNIEKLGPGIFSLDLRTVNKGIYFLTVNVNGKLINRKIIKN